MEGRREPKASLNLLTPVVAAGAGAGAGVGEEDLGPVGARAEFDVEDEQVSCENGFSCE